MSQLSQRPIYLLSYNNRLFPAHWALWIPSQETNPTKTIGKVIHVEGDSLNGFNHGFKKNYDLETDERARELVFLGWADSANVVDGDNDGLLVIDAVATDAFERCALEVPAPGPSLRAVGSGVSVCDNTYMDLRNASFGCVTFS